MANIRCFTYYHIAFGYVAFSDSAMLKYTLLYCVLSCVIRFFLSILCCVEMIQVVNEPGRRYNSQLMNAVVLYVGTQAIAHIRSKGQTPNMSTIAHSAHMDIFQNFTVDFDYEGR